MHRRRARSHILAYKPKAQKKTDSGHQANTKRGERHKRRSREGRAWELVSIELSSAPVCVFQNLMQRSAVPPPDASRFACEFVQSATTAAHLPGQVC